MFKIDLDTIYKIRRIILRTVLKFFSAKSRANYIKKSKVLFHCGENCSFTTVDFGNEPYLISIHDNVEIASNVTFLNHDDSCFMISKYIGAEQRLDKVGSIEIYDNCFIGAKSIILPNVKIGPNSIVGAGSVVTKNVPPNSIAAGNPAKLINTVDAYSEKLKMINNEYEWRSYLHNPKENNKKIIEMRIKHFWGE